MYDVVAWFGGVNTSLVLATVIGGFVILWVVAKWWATSESRKSESTVCRMFPVRPGQKVAFRLLPFCLLQAKK